jgi:DNA repair protein RecO (recombination protein O)
MALIETESLVLKSYDLAEADKIVVLLTHDHGIVRGVAKGAKRLKSKFGSGLEPFSVVQSTYFQKDAVELVAIERIDLLRSSFLVASDPAFLERFSYLADLLLSLTPPHDPSQTLYRMVKACVHAASDNEASLLSVGVYFELWLLRIAGYLPDWSRCEQCFHAFLKGEGSFLSNDFHLICSDCRSDRAHGIVSPELRTLAGSILRTPPSDFAVHVSERSDDLNELSNISKRMISKAIGREVSGNTLDHYGVKRT